MIINLHCHQSRRSHERMTQGLGKTTQSVYDSIVSFWAEIWSSVHRTLCPCDGYSLDMREIMKGTGLKSTSTVAYHMANPETDKTPKPTPPQSPIILMDGKFRCEVDGYVFEGYDHTGDVIVLESENMLDELLSDIVHDVILDDAYDGLVGKIIFFPDPAPSSET